MKRNNWNPLGIKRSIDMECVSTLIWNEIQLVFKRAIDVEWYLKIFSFGIKSIDFRIWNGMIDNLKIEITCESKETVAWRGMQPVFKRAIDLEWYSKSVSLGIKSIDL